MNKSLDPVLFSKLLDKNDVIIAIPKDPVHQAVERVRAIDLIQSAISKYNYK
jgi:hypothetical protein